MSSTDWRSPAGYEDLRSLDAPGFAWQYLRRNPEFARERAKLEDADRRERTDSAVAEQFSKNWGCHYLSAVEGQEENAVLWTASALPSVISLTELPDGLADPKFRIPRSELQFVVPAVKGEIIWARGDTLVRLHVTADNLDPPAVMLALDRLFEIRLTTALRFWRVLMGRNACRDPALLSKARRDRLILGLRALDGRLERASYREIADTLFGARDIPSQEWKGHDLRDRTVRLVRYGQNMMRGGYRALLLHPYRRRA